jgi:hypothetical protein
MAAADQRRSQRDDDKRPHVLTREDEYPPILWISALIVYVLRKIVRRALASGPLVRETTAMVNATWPISSFSCAAADPGTQRANAGDDVGAVLLRARHQFDLKTSSRVRIMSYPSLASLTNSPVATRWLRIALAIRMRFSSVSGQP